MSGVQFRKSGNEKALLLSEEVLATSVGEKKAITKHCLWPSDRKVVYESPHCPQERSLAEKQACCWPPEIRCSSIEHMYQFLCLAPTYWWLLYQNNGLHLRVIILAWSLICLTRTCSRNIVLWLGLSFVRQKEQKTFSITLRLHSNSLLLNEVQTHRSMCVSLCLFGVNGGWPNCRDIYCRVKPCVNIICTGY